MLWALLFLVASVTAGYRRYDGHKLVEIVPETETHLHLLREWFVNSHLDFWLKPTDVGAPVHIFAAQEEVESIGMDFQYKVISDSIQKQIDEERARLMQKSSTYYDYGDFNSYETIMAEVEALASRCPSGFQCDLYSIGQSVENEELMVMHISQPGVERDAIWIDSTIHAREWLATTTMMWILRNLIDNYGSDPSPTNAMDKFDFYIMPIVNPDGYKHSYNSERLWRKNRGVNENSSCLGTDLNRNFDFEWSTSGTSTNPCSETYHGAYAASEPEVAAQQDEMLRIAATGQNIFAGISIHTYGQYWLMNFGHQVSGQCAISPDHDAQYWMCDRVAQATMATYGTTWRYGPICSVLYPASGNTIDYMYARVGILYAFLPELRGGSFIVSPDQIEPSFNEVWAGLDEIFA